MSIIPLFFSLFLYFSHVVDSQTCDSTAVTAANTCCVGALSIATTVTSITDYAYEGCKTLTSLEVSSTVITIGSLLLFVYLFIS